MSKQFTGVQSVENVSEDVLTELFTKGRLPTEQFVLESFPYPNSFVVVKSVNSGSAICRISRDGKYVQVIKHVEASGLKPRNKEQTMLLSTLLDDDIPVQVVTGIAGTGKTLIAIAVAMQKIEEGVYDKIILTKPMSQVGKYDLGILPGTIAEKFAPFLINYASNVEQILGGGKKKKNRNKQWDAESTNPITGIMADFFNTYNVEMVPIQVLRGASFSRAFIIADEIQVLGHHELLTIGTRVAEDSKLVLMGDLNQRDEKIAKNATGLWQLINNEVSKKSNLLSFIDLIKVERGPVPELFCKIFPDKD